MVTLKHALKFVRRARDYMRAYKDGAKGLEVEVVKKVHKTHHRCALDTLITRSALNLVQTFALFYVLDIPRSVLVKEGVFPCIFYHYKFFFLLILYCTVPMWVHKKSEKIFFFNFNIFSPKVGQRARTRRADSNGGLRIFF